MAYIPYVVEQSNHGERSYDIFSRLLNDRIILLHDQVNSATASVVVAELLYLEGQDPDKDIYLYINSPGGSVSDGMAIYDTMQYIKCDVSTICTGMAASMGAFLLSSGAKGKRIALPNSEIMIHQPLISGNGLSGQVTDIMIHSARTPASPTRTSAATPRETTSCPRKKRWSTVLSTRFTAAGLISSNDHVSAGERLLSGRSLFLRGTHNYDGLLLLRKE